MLSLALLAALGALLALFLIMKVSCETSPPATTAPPPDPVAEEVSKWMHQWERGRA